MSNTGYPSGFNCETFTATIWYEASPYMGSQDFAISPPNIGNRFSRKMRSSSTVLNASHDLGESMFNTIVCIFVGTTGCSSIGTGFQHEGILRWIVQENTNYKTYAATELEWSAVKKNRYGRECLGRWSQPLFLNVREGHTERFKIRLQASPWQWYFGHCQAKLRASACRQNFTMLKKMKNLF